VTERKSVSSIFLEAQPVGEYVVRFDVTEAGTDGRDRHEYVMDVREAERIRHSLDNAIDSIRSRQMVDLACGDCEVCSNTRMVQVEKTTGMGGKETIHCPVCHPKIIEMRKKVKS
jgi:hypothetical protein